MRAKLKEKLNQRNYDECCQHLRSWRVKGHRLIDLILIHQPHNIHRRGQIIEEDDVYAKHHPISQSKITRWRKRVKKREMDGWCSHKRGYGETYPLPKVLRVNEEGKQTNDRYDSYGENVLHEAAEEWATHIQVEYKVAEAVTTEVVFSDRGRKA